MAIYINQNVYLGNHIVLLNLLDMLKIEDIKFIFWSIIMSTTLYIICAELFNDSDDLYLPLKCIFSFAVIIYSICYIHHHFTTVIKYIILLSIIVLFHYLAQSAMEVFLDRFCRKFDEYFLIVNSIIVFISVTFCSFQKSGFILLRISELHLLLGLELLLCAIIYNNTQPYYFFDNLMLYTLFYYAIYVGVAIVKIIYYMCCGLFFNDNKTMNKILK